MLLEAISIFGEIILFRGVFSRRGGRMGWRISYEITVAGGVATQILATAGTSGEPFRLMLLRLSTLPGKE